MWFAAVPCGKGHAMTIYFHMLANSLLAVIQPCSSAQFELRAGEGKVLAVHAVKVYRGEEKCSPTHS